MCYRILASCHKVSKHGLRHARIAPTVFRISSSDKLIEINRKYSILCILLMLLVTPNDHAVVLDGFQICIPTKYDYAYHTYYIKRYFHGSDLVTAQLLPKQIFKTVDKYMAQINENVQHNYLITKHKETNTTTR